MADDQGGRARWAGTARELAELIGSEVEPFGRTFLKYDEVAKVSCAKTEVSNTEESYNLLAAVHKANPKLRRNKATLIARIEILLSDNEGAERWIIKESDHNMYVQVMTNRLANICHVVHATEQRHPTCKWVRNLPWRGGDIDEEGSGKNNKQTLWLTSRRAMATRAQVHPTMSTPVVSTRTSCKHGGCR